jgi:hypothetical protein
VSVRWQDEKSWAPVLTGIDTTSDVVESVTVSGLVGVSHTTTCKSSEANESDQPSVLSESCLRAASGDSPWLLVAYEAQFRLSKFPVVK